MPRCPQEFGRWKADGQAVTDQQSREIAIVSPRRGERPKTKENKTKTSGFVPQNARRGQDSEAPDIIKKSELGVRLLY